MTTRIDRGFSFPKFLVLTVLFLLALLFAASVRAQAQTSQYLVGFTTASNHTVVEHGATVVANYVLVIRRPGASADDPDIDLGKPTAGNSAPVTVNVTPQLAALPQSNACNLAAPTAATCYFASVRTIGPGGVALSSSAPFVLTMSRPGAATGVGISRQ